MGTSASPSRSGLSEKHSCESGNSFFKYIVKRKNLLFASATALLLGGLAFLGQGEDTSNCHLVDRPLTSMERMNPHPGQRLTPESQGLATLDEPGPKAPYGQIDEGTQVFDGVALVQPKDRTSARSVLASLGSQVLFEGTHSNLWRVSVPEGVSVAAFVRQLEQKGDAFSSAQAEGIIRATSVDPDSAAYGDYQWNLEQMGWDEAFEHYPELVDDLDGILVAVVDSGVAYEDYADDSLTYAAASDLGASNIYPGPDYVDSDGHPNDVSGHGTHIAATLAANGGTIGVAPEVSLMPIRILNEDNVGAEASLAEAIYYAVDNGANIINLSLSFAVGYIPGNAVSTAFQYATDNNVIVAAAAGNDSLEEIPYPAAYAGVISVGASRLTVGHQSWIADYSNVGSALEIVAPGGSGSLDVNDDGMPDGIPAQTCEPGNPSALHYYMMSGTSQAVAHVSGAAAWLLAAGASPDEVRTTLSGTTSGTWGKKKHRRRGGVGIVDLNRALKAHYNGYNVGGDQYYVNHVALLQSENDQLSAIGLIKVVDDEGLPARKIMVVGHWFGSDSSRFAVLTNSDGLAMVPAESAVDSDQPALFGLQIDRMLDRRKRVTQAPVGFYYLTEGMWNAIRGWYGDERLAGAELVFSVGAGAVGLPDGVVDSYVAKPMGANNGLVPTVLAINQAYMDALLDPSTTQNTIIEATFDVPVEFGWGYSDAASVRLADDSAAGGARLTIATFDSGMFYDELAEVLPVLNTSSSDFGSGNDTFHNNLDSAASGAVVVSSIIGGDSVWSSLIGGDSVWSSLIGGDSVWSSLIGGDSVWSSLIGGDSVWSSLLDGDVVVSSLIGGDSVWSSLIGGDLVQSTILGGDSSAMQVLEDGEAIAIIGDGSLVSGTEDTTTVEVLETTVELPIMATSSHTDTAADTPFEIGAGTFTPESDIVVVTPDTY